ncbi:MAG: hypothetical protein AAFN91_18010 [Pseudomonadota bacterium]
MKSFTAHFKYEVNDTFLVQVVAFDANLNNAVCIDLAADDLAELMVVPIGSLAICPELLDEHVEGVDLP